MRFKSKLKKKSKNCDLKKGNGKTNIEEERLRSRRRKWNKFMLWNEKHGTKDKVDFYLYAKPIVRIKRKRDYVPEDLYIQVMLETYKNTHLRKPQKRKYEFGKCYTGDSRKSQKSKLEEEKWKDETIKEW